MVSRRGDQACGKGQSCEIDFLRARIFYLSFENSLCAEYITVKWSYFIKLCYIVFLLFILACLLRYRELSYFAHEHESGSNERGFKETYLCLLLTF